MLNTILLSVLFPTLAASDCKAGPGNVVPAVSKSVWVIAQDRKNNYWFGSDGEGVFRYDGKSIVNYTTKDGLPSERVREIKEDKSGSIFIGTLNGISKFDGRAFTTLVPTRMASSNEGWRLDSDDLWFKGSSTESGPYRYDGKTLYHLRFPKHHLEDEKRAMNPNPPASMYGVYTIYKDRKGSLWFGTASVGLARYDGKSINWLYEEQLTNPPTGGSFGIRSIIEDREGKFWICNTQNRYDVSPTSSPTNGLAKYKSEVGTGSLTPLIGQDFVYYQSVVQGKEGDLWMAPYVGGVLRYDGKKVTRYPVNFSEHQSNVLTLFKDNRNDLWIGTHASGLYKFNGKSFESWPSK